MGSAADSDFSPAMSIGTLRLLVVNDRFSSRERRSIEAANAPVSRQSIWGAVLYPTNPSAQASILSVIVACISSATVSLTSGKISRIADRMSSSAQPSPLTFIEPWRAKHIPSTGPSATADLIRSSISDLRL